MSKKTFYKSNEASLHSIKQEHYYPILYFPKKGQGINFIINNSFTKIFIRPIYLGC